jgi:hypothetical protein
VHIDGGFNYLKYGYTTPEFELLQLRHDVLTPKDLYNDWNTGKDLLGRWKKVTLPIGWEILPRGSTDDTPQC